jgi:hypothetical protein
MRLQSRLELYSTWRMETVEYLTILEMPYKIVHHVEPAEPSSPIGRLEHVNKTMWDLRPGYIQYKSTSCVSTTQLPIKVLSNAQ